MGSSLCTGVQFFPEDVQKFVEEDISWGKSPAARLSVSNYFKNSAPVSTLESSSMLDYIQKRDLNGSHIGDVVGDPSVVAPVRSLSSLLTFPLTLSYSLCKVHQSLYGQLGGSISSRPASNGKNGFRVLIVGARSESSLPLLWWNEYLYNFKDILPQTVIKTIGPGLQINKSILKQNTATYDYNNLQYSLEFSNDLNSNPRSNDLKPLHDHPDCIKLLRWADVFVLFNPGYGSDPLLSQWDPTIRLLLQTKKPVVCTAHGPADLTRDLTALDRISSEEDWQDLGENVDLLFAPHENPFRSMKQTLDQNEIEECKVVTANHSIYCFIAK